ncbi:MAG: DUF885 family protein [Asticcacaulis sp.]|uniref:DUF885 domain-containing protein n=1 Tax=Asticcacaulis sp. TaxID=1872648 RepID=UPI0039E52A0C
MAKRIGLISGICMGVALACGVPALAQTAPAAPAASQNQTADQRVIAIYSAEWDWRRKELGLSADGTFRGMNSDTLPSVTPETYARRLAYWDKALADLAKVSFDQLSDTERVNAEVFRAQVSAFADDARFKTYEAPINSDTFFWTLNPRAPFKTAEEYRHYLNRLKDIPRYFDEQTANMKAGLKRGYTVPKVSTLGREKTLEPYMAGDTSNPLYDVFARMPDSISAADQAQIQAEAKTVIHDVAPPAYVRFHTFFVKDYQPNARDNIAAESLPDGKAYYQSRIREYTTTDYTPEQIHEIGLKEVARIRADMEATMKASGFKGTFPEFLVFLRTDPQFYPKTPHELLAFSAYVAKRVDGKLKDQFNLLPRYRFTILPVPDNIAPIYTSGRGGLDSCLMNTYNLPSRPLYNLTALTLHECIPGHSFQAALALEAPERPAFRRTAGFSAYGEGWALYCEWLGTVMQMYDTPYEEFGRETFEMWRAARLVIDTGIHHYGWSRQQAIDYLTENTALAHDDIVNEVDRYIAWPGQALAYKLGELSIRNLRAKAQVALGTHFDPRPFHDKILELGSVPLPTLEEEMNAFIATQKAAIKTDPAA